MLQHKFIAKNHWLNKKLCNFKRLISITRTHVTLEFDDVCFELNQVSGKTTENPDLSGPDYINDKT